MPHLFLLKLRQNTKRVCQISILTHPLKLTYYKYLNNNAFFPIIISEFFWRAIFLFLEDTVKI